MIASLAPGPVKESFQRLERAATELASLAGNVGLTIVAPMSPRAWLCFAFAAVAALSFSACGKPREPEPFRGSSSAAPAPGTTPAPVTANAGTNANSTAVAQPPAAPQASDSSTAPAGSKPGDASLRGYARNLASAQTVAGKTIDEAALNRAVQQFGAMEGRLPKSLEELVSEKYLPEIPKAPLGHRIDYDPNSGKVTVVRVNP